MFGISTLSTIVGKRSMLGLIGGGVVMLVLYTILIGCGMESFSGDYYGSAVQFVEWDTAGGASDSLYIADVAADLDGTLFCSDIQGKRVLHFDRYGKLLEQWPSMIGADSTYVPGSIAISVSGALYVCCPDSFVAVYSRRGLLRDVFPIPARNIAAAEGDTFVVTCVASRCVTVMGGAGQQIASWRLPGLDEELGGVPGGVIVSGLNQVWVSDLDNGKLYRYSTRGDSLGEVGGDDSALGPLRAQYSLGRDTYDDIYALNTELSQVIVIDAFGGRKGQWGRIGSGPGEFVRPTGLAVTLDREIYACDEVSPGRSRMVGYVFFPPVLGAD